MKTLSVKLLTVAALFCGLSACKKDKKAPRYDGLLDWWTQELPASGEARQLYFAKDSLFYYVRPPYQSAVPIKKFKGTYVLRGDSIITRFGEGNFTGMANVPQEFAPLASTPGAYVLFNLGTYKHRGDTLSITYLPYLGQARPSATTAVFIRNPTID